MIKKYNDEFLIQVETKKEIILSIENIDDIMVSALEGGITYWCGKAQVIGNYISEWGHEQIARGGTLRLYDIENPDEYWDLTLNKFLNGFKLWVESSHDVYGAVQNDGTVDCCKIDAQCADEIIQFSLFGELTFC